MSSTVECTAPTRPLRASTRVRERLKAAGARFHANDNIAAFLRDGELEELNACAALERALHPDGDRQGTAGLTDAVHRFLMATHSALAIVQIEDVLGMRRQANLPGTEDSAPNWRQRLPLSLEDLGNDDRLWRAAEIFRGRQRGS